MSVLFDSTALVVPFENLRMSDVDAVGGKNASLGEMISQLPSGVSVPTGFATTAHAFRVFLKQDHLDQRIEEVLKNLDSENINDLSTTGASIRSWILNQPFPPSLESEVRQAFATLNAGATSASYAVRSSATAEDLPDASFAGQQESFLNVQGIEDVLLKIKEVFASLYNDRAISYRVHKGFVHADVALSAGVQKMVRSDLATSGVMFTIDTESGFSDVVFITSSYGLGETVVQGAVNPDEFYVHKPMLRAGNQAIVRRSLGSKLIQMKFASETERQQSGKLVVTADVPSELRNRYSLTDDEICQLAQYALTIESHYGHPMDIEWGKDGLDGKLYILQARPETVKSQSKGKAEHKYKLKNKSTVLAEGRAIGQKIGTGPVRLVSHISQMDTVQPGDILVTDMTDPNWEPVMKKASAIVTNRGGRTCHAAIIARELGIPAVVGCGNACAEGDTGFIYDGLLETEVFEVKQGVMPEIATKIMMNIGNPSMAFDFAQLPNAGVGLARLEFIINNNIGVHPKAILDYPNIDLELKKAVESVARGHASPKAFFVDKVTEGVATIAAAFWPKPVIVRLSDFKSNEYRKLIGGSRYEPEEENPMLGFRGAARYLSADFQQAFAMECQALRRVRQDMGLTNVQIMVPFVRTVGQAKRVVDLLSQQGLARGENGLKLIMMCEVPSNALLADEFLEFFDGFSIGSNDLTQLTLGLDRDSGMPLLAADFDERDPAVKLLLSKAIEACQKQNKYVGICGQGPSDHLDFAKWLVSKGIESISLNPDSVIATWHALAS
ncbi:MAG: phosphoenolpyruvate synthase [Betaproteobacteria bacterium]|nr:phosphoenolpyruvate synthase [Betaproteobacteria bacterium]